MSIAAELLKDSRVRALLAKIASSIGYLNLLQSILRARRANKGPSSEVARYIVLEIWKSLGSRTAVVCYDGKVSYGQLADKAARLSNAFRKRGVSPQDRVATLLGNETAWFYTMCACMVSGIKMPMLSTHLSREELVQCINTCAPKILVYGSEFAETIQSVSGDLDQSITLVCADSNRADDTLSLADVANEGVPKLAPGGNFGLAQTPFSGGSTGLPKYVAEDDSIPDEDNPRLNGVSEADINGMKVLLAKAFGKLGFGSIPGQIVTLIPGPLYHGGPQLAVIPLLFGGTIVAMQKYNAELFLQMIENYRVNFSSVTPTHLERVLKLPEATKSKYDLSSMRVAISNAAPCAPRVKKEINVLFKKQGCRNNIFRELYGSSEAAGISILTPADYEADPNRYASVGQPTGAECLIYNIEEKKKCAPGEVGNILVRTVRMYKVRYGGNSEIDNFFQEVDGSYWYNDGCVGYLDEDNYLYLTSRSKDMIISGGVNVFPPEIEHVIKSHPSILDAAVIKVPDPDLGEVAGAVLQLMDGCEIDAEEVLAYCREHGLYGFKIPKFVTTVPELPTNEAGKIRKADLDGIFASADPV